MALNAVCPHCKNQFDLRLDAKLDTDYSCPGCHENLQIVSGSPLALSLRREQALSGVVFDAEVLVSDLVEDCNQLLQLGIVLDKGALGAKAAGVAGGAYAALQGHWLLGAAVAAAGFLANLATDDWKRIKLSQVRQKWFHRLTTIDEAQLNELTSALRRRHPALMMHGQSLLALSCSVGTLITQSFGACRTLSLRPPRIGRQMESNGEF